LPTLILRRISGDPKREPVPCFQLWASRLSSRDFLGRWGPVCQRFACGHPQWWTPHGVWTSSVSTRSTGGAGFRARWRRGPCRVDLPSSKCRQIGHKWLRMSDGARSNMLKRWDFLG